MGVSTSGFYHWRSKPKEIPTKDEKLLDKLISLFDESQGTYGVTRLTNDLRELGEVINHKRVARAKRENGLYPKQCRYFVVTTDSKHGKPVAKNHLNRQFKVSEPNTVWVSDITYIPYRHGMLYLSVVLDLHSRKVIGWQLANHMKAELVSETIERAIVRRGCLPKLFHSDRGSQYVSELVANKLQGVTISMSRKGNCWDNAVAESFFGTLKLEHINFENYVTMDQARASLFNYIEGFYNRTRKHSSLNYLSPNDFEKLAG
jgi:transposase InsO family protein